MVLNYLIADTETMTSEKIPAVKVDNEIFFLTFNPALWYCCITWKICSFHLVVALNNVHNQNLVK